MTGFMTISMSGSQVLAILNIFILFSGKLIPNLDVSEKFEAIDAKCCNIHCTM